jgi:hypothetical protein
VEEPDGMKSPINPATDSRNPPFIQVHAHAEGAASDVEMSGLLATAARAAITDS